MRKTWKNAYELAAAMEERALCGRNVILSPGTAVWIARQIQNAVARRHAPPPVRSPFAIDLYATGSCVMTITETGDIFEVVAWARSSMVARAAFDYLAVQYPETRFEQRRGSWVESG